MAQLVARFHGMEEVRGSNPLSSTKSVMLEPPAIGRRFFVLSGVVTSRCFYAPGEPHITTEHGSVGLDRPTRYLIRSHRRRSPIRPLDYPHPCLRSHR